jgi:hypothetical protein
MEIYNELPEELQRLVDEYCPLRKLEKKYQDIIRCIGKWNGKFYNHHSKQAMWTYSDIQRNTIYDLTTEKGRKNFVQMKYRLDKVVTQMLPFRTDNQTVCCMRHRPEEHLLRCPNGHAVCKYRPEYALRTDGRRYGPHYVGVKTVKPYQLIDHTRVRYNCNVCNKNFIGNQWEWD